MRCMLDTSTARQRARKGIVITLYVLIKLSRVLYCQGIICFQRCDIEYRQTENEENSAISRGTRFLFIVCLYTGNGVYAECQRVTCL